MEHDERALLAGSLDQIFAATPAGRIETALEEFGWRELLADDPAPATSILLGLQGKHLASTTVLDLVTLQAAGVDDTHDIAVVYPGLAADTPTSRMHGDDTGVSLTVEGVVTVRSRPPSRVAVPTVYGDEFFLAVLPWSRDEWPTMGSGMDPDGGLARLRATLRVDDPGRVVDSAAVKAWQRMCTAALRALSYELLSIGGRMLELALEHVSSREQFGKQLGSFQAVKHKLADVRLWQEGAELAAEAAWETDNDVEAEHAAVLAKLAANRFTAQAREHCQQVLGGMGFTWEHDFHRYTRRALILEPLLGNSRSLRSILGTGMKTTETLPHLASL